MFGKLQNMTHKTAHVICSFSLRTIVEGDVAWAFVQVDGGDDDVGHACLVCDEWEDGHRVTITVVGLVVDYHFWSLVKGEQLLGGHLEEGWL